VGLVNTLSPKSNPTAISTYATWGDGIATLLPKVDLIALVDTSAPKNNTLLGLYPWDTVAAIVPGMQEQAIEGSPPYFKVEKFPPRDQIQVLKPFSH
jgi:hypothetical protein